MTAPIVTVRGSAQLEGPPDLATLSFTMHSTGNSADRVRSELFGAAARVEALLEEFGSALERKTVTGLHIAPVFDRRSASKITGYRGSFSAEIITGDFGSVASVVLALTPLPNSEINGPWWSLRPDSPLHHQVRVAAIADARIRADDYAAAFGTQVEDLVEISDLDGGFAGGRAMASFARSEAAGEPSFEFEPVIQTVSGQVTVRFTMAAPDLGRGGGSPGGPG